MADGISTARASRRLKSIVFPRRIGGLDIVRKVIVVGRSIASVNRTGISLRWRSMSIGRVLSTIASRESGTSGGRPM